MVSQYHYPPLFIQMKKKTPGQDCELLHHPQNLEGKKKKVFSLMDSGPASMNNMAGSS